MRGNHMDMDATYAVVQFARRGESLLDGGEVAQECALIFADGGDRLVFQGPFEAIEEKVTLALAVLRSQTGRDRATRQPEPLPARDVGDLLARVLATPDTAEDVGPHFTCTEIDLLAAALQLTGKTRAAARLLTGHANSPEEEEDDLHGHWPRTASIDPDETHPVWDYLQHLHGTTS